MYVQTDGQVNNIMPPAAYYHHQFNMHKCSMNNKLNKKNTENDTKRYNTHKTKLEK